MMPFLSAFSMRVVREKGQKECKEELITSNDLCPSNAAMQEEIPILFGQLNHHYCCLDCD